MKIGTRAWAADTPFNDGASVYYLAPHDRGVLLHRCWSWRRAIRRHALALWFVIVILVLSMSWVKVFTSAPTRGSLRPHNRGITHSPMVEAIASALSRRHATDESVP